MREAGDGRLRVVTRAGEWLTQALISATGTWDRPFWPSVPGQRDFTGRQLHTATYPGPEAFRGERVVVIGGGTSAVQHLRSYPVAARTVWVTRRPPVFRDEPLRRRGRQGGRRPRRGAGTQRPAAASVVCVTGLPMTRTARPGPRASTDAARCSTGSTPDGVPWDDGTTVAADTLLWATGFRPSLAHLAPLGLREPGGGILLDGTRVVRDPRVDLVGYGPSASTIGANRAGRAAVREITALLSRAETLVAA